MDCILLNLKYDDYQKNYTLKNIENLESYTETGRYIKTKILPDSIVISDIIEYTGIRISTLLEEIPNLPENYNIIVFSKDVNIFSADKAFIFVAIPGSKSDSCVKTGIPISFAANTGVTLTNPPLEKSIFGFSFIRHKKACRPPIIILIISKIFFKEKYLLHFPQ